MGPTSRQLTRLLPQPRKEALRPPAELLVSMTTEREKDVRSFVCFHLAAESSFNPGRGFCLDGRSDGDQTVQSNQSRGGRLGHMFALTTLPNEGRGGLEPITIRGTFTSLHADLTPVVHIFQAVCLLHALLKSQTKRDVLPGGGA